MTMYKLIDMENEDTIYKGESLREMKKVAGEYDECCEGDWICLAGRKVDSGKWEVFDFKF